MVQGTYGIVLNEIVRHDSDYNDEIGAPGVMVVLTIDTGGVSTGPRTLDSNPPSGSLMAITKAQGERITWVSPFRDVKSVRDV